MKTANKAVGFLHKAIKELGDVIKYNQEEETKLAGKIVDLDIQKNDARAERDYAMKVKEKLEGLLA